MRDLKAQEFYQLYRKKTIEAGFVPIGRQRFTGIIKTLSLIPESIEYIQNKANGDDSDNANCAIFDVSNNEVAVCVNCDQEKETHNICSDCLTKIINENKQTDC